MKVKEWKGYQKGVNIGGWFSQCPHTTANYDSFAGPADMTKIKSWGCDHVRIPVDYKLFADEEMNFRESGFTYLRNCIDMCRSAGLNMILDLHQTYGFAFHTYDRDDNFFTNRTYQDFFVKTWSELARRFGGDSDILAFELMNEVTEQRFSDTWNRIAGEAITAIREFAPTIKIVVGSYWHNSAVALKDLVIPADDRNIILNFHCYSPMIFTHQGAGWVPELENFGNWSYLHTYAEYDKKNVELYPRNVGAFDMMGDMSANIGPEYFRRQFTEALNAAAKYDAPLYCGEYGVIDTVDPEETLKWYTDIHSVFEEYGIGRAAWSYRRMNFGLEGEHYAPILDRLVKVL